MATPKTGQGGFVCFNNHDEATKAVTEITRTWSMGSHSTSHMLSGKMFAKSQLEAVELRR
jgi:hypothetical protein